MSAEVRRACMPKKRADKPVGEWNQMSITMKGDRLTVVLNGEEVISSAQLPGVPPGPRRLPARAQHHPVQERLPQRTEVNRCNPDRFLA
jgi:hypothetical protein